ncbi:FRS3 factor, partial [Amia calva]|nr:FRS3 factor [Amia calva]
MGSCWSCLYRDTIPDNHPTKFKVTNVDDEGNELGSGTMELTQTELILHTRKRDAVRWPYLCLRRYGYDSNLFSFESGRRCQTGQGIFAFKCSRAEEIFNLLQELMQCNSINVVEEPVIITHSSHAPELDLPRTPQSPNTPAYTVQGFPNGYPGYPVSADSSHASTRHPSLADEHGHSLLALEDQVSASPGHRGHSASSAPLSARCVSSALVLSLCSFLSPSGPHLCEHRHGHRKTALLNYENLPSLPPVWEYRALQRAEQRHEDEDEEDDEPDDEEDEDEDEEDDEYSEDPGTPNGYHQDGGVARNYVNTGRVQQGMRRPACPPRRQHRADCHVGGGNGVFSFDFRRGGSQGGGREQRQLNYIQVDLDGEVERGMGGGASQHQQPCGPPPPRRSEFYAVIDLKKTAAMSSLQRALPRDDGTSRKTRHNSTDLPL